jgi:hypothetical protein
MAFVFVAILLIGVLPLRWICDRFGNRRGCRNHGERRNGQNRVATMHDSSSPGEPATRAISRYWRWMLLKPTVERQSNTIPTRTILVEVFYNDGESQLGMKPSLYLFGFLFNARHAS